MSVDTMPLSIRRSCPRRLLAGNPRPNDADINAAMLGNLCHCGTYVRNRDALPKTLHVGRNARRVRRDTFSIPEIYQPRARRLLLPMSTRYLSIFSIWWTFPPPEPG